MLIYSLPLQMPDIWESFFSFRLSSILWQAQPLYISSCWCFSPLRLYICFYFSIFLLYEHSFFLWAACLLLTEPIYREAELLTYAWYIFLLHTSFLSLLHIAIFSSFTYFLRTTRDFVLSLYTFLLMTAFPPLPCFSSFSRFLFLQILLSYILYFFKRQQRTFSAFSSLHFYLIYIVSWSHNIYISSIYISYIYSSSSSYILYTFSALFISSLRFSFSSLFLTYFFEDVDSSIIFFDFLLRRHDNDLFARGRLSARRLFSLISRDEMRQ